MNQQFLLQWGLIVNMPFLLTCAGARKYLNSDERFRLYNHIRSSTGEIEMFCWILLETGCRISEALALGRRNIDLSQRAIAFESLKKRRRGVFRAVPVSDDLVGCLEGYFSLSQMPDSTPVDERLWSWSRTTAYRRVCAMMRACGISGMHASPKGLRHGFGVAAVSAGVSLNLVQRWLGHADIKTTAIYANVWGDEERSIASRIWLTTATPSPTKSRARA